MPRTLRHARTLRPAAEPCVPIWCEERRRRAKVAAGVLVGLRHDTGELTTHLIGDPERIAQRIGKWSAEKSATPLHPALIERLAGARVGERRMYLGNGRNRAVAIESVEPAPIPRRVLPH